MRNKFKRVRKVLDIASRMAADSKDWRLRGRFEDVNIYGEYAEPGYSADGPILTGNWNSVEGDNGLVKRVGNILEKIGCELEWEDEWSTCGDCGGLVRTEPTSYHWTPSYAFVYECELLCLNCLKKDLVPYLEEMEGNSSKAITFDVDLSQYGYEQYNKERYESGWYGQNDDPKAIAKMLRAKGITRFIFVIDGKGQFDINFSVWVHESELKEDEDVQ
jgi:hypothetical protein